MWRAAAWLGIVALALAARHYDSNALRTAAAGAVFVLLAAGAPRALLAPLACSVLLALALLFLRGASALVDALPAFVAAFVAWLFARTLLGARRPLIARAIAALDGPAELDDPAVARYARRLTALWACYQALLALAGAALATFTWAGTLPPWCPGPRAFGALILPAAVAALLLGEFALRRRLLPQAPRHRLLPFVYGLVRAWPALLED